jgi:hypothetical protein
MKKKRLLTLIGAASLLAISGFTVVNSNGSLTGYTDSPPDGPGDCTGCHRGGAATPTITFTASPAFGSGNTYVPNVTYTISIGETGYPYFGFDFEMCNGNTATAVDGGVFGAVVTLCHLTPPSSPYPTNITQNARIPTASKAQFKWTAPASGKCYAYMCLNGVNGDGTVNGDKALPWTLILSPSPAGISELADSKTNLSFFPNPASDNLNLSYFLEKASTIQIQIFNMEGKKVADLFNQKMDAGAQTYTATLPTDLAKGTYLLNLLVDGQPTMKKLIIR